MKIARKKTSTAKKMWAWLGVSGVVLTVLGVWAFQVFQQVSHDTFARIEDNFSQSASQIQQGLDVAESISEEEASLQSIGEILKEFDREYKHAVAQQEALDHVAQNILDDIQRPEESPLADAVTNHINEQLESQE